MEIIKKNEILLYVRKLATNPDHLIVEFEGDFGHPIGMLSARSICSTTVAYAMFEGMERGNYYIFYNDWYEFKRDQMED